MSAPILGIEIGGTKLQFGVGTGSDATFREFVKLEIDRSRGAEGIRKQISIAAKDIQSNHPIEAIGLGFGGPVDGQSGRTITSHQVEGWQDFPLANWMRDLTGLPTAIGNDCDVAALAEATFGAGQGHQTVLYVTVGTGIGGGLVIDGKLHGLSRPAAAEIGHMRPGLTHTKQEQTVESIASGLGMEQQAMRLAADNYPGTQNLTDMCLGNVSNITGQTLAEAAKSGNELALHVIGTGAQTLGWAIAQSATLIAPDVVIVGGGVSLMPEYMFMDPIREAIQTYVFPPLQDSFSIERPMLGEDVVVHGAIANARQALFDS